MPLKKKGAAFDEKNPLTDVKHVGGSILLRDFLAASATGNIQMKGQMDSSKCHAVSQETEAYKMSVYNRRMIQSIPQYTL